MENQPKKYTSCSEKQDNISISIPSFDVLGQDTNITKFNNFQDSKESYTTKIRFISYQKLPFFTSKKIKNRRDNIKKSISNYSIGRWTKKERTIFALGIYEYGPNFNKINDKIPTRNIIQIRSHAQKFLKKLKSSEYLEKKI